MQSDEGAVFEPRQIIRLEEIDDLRRRVQILEQEVQQRSTKIDSDSNEKVDLIDEVTILFGHAIWFFFVFETLYHIFERPFWGSHYKGFDCSGNEGILFDYNPCHLHGHAWNLIPIFFGILLVWIGRKRIISQYLKRNNGENSS